MASVRGALENCSHARHLSTAREDHLGLLDRVARQVATFGALRTVSREELTQALDLATEVKGLVHAVIADIGEPPASLSGVFLPREIAQSLFPHDWALLETTL